MSASRAGRVLLLALLVGSCGLPSYGQDPPFPPPPNSILSLRVVLDHRTRGLVLATVRDRETRQKLAAITDYVLQRTGQVLGLRYALDAERPTPPAVVLEAYERWASEHTLRPMAWYRLRQRRALDSTASPDGLAQAYYSAADSGGLLVVLAEARYVTIVWAPGRLELGPIVAAWLGLHSANVDVDSTSPEIADAALPNITAPLPWELLIGRLDLTANDLVPLARYMGALPSDALQTAEVSKDVLLLIRLGPAALAPVRGMTALVFATEGADDRARVRAPAVAWAEEQGWANLLNWADGPTEASLFARFGEEGGCLVVGHHGDLTGVIVTDGCPDLSALLLAAL